MTVPSRHCGAVPSSKNRNGSPTPVTTDRRWDTWSLPVINGQPRLWLSLTWFGKQQLLFSEIKNGDIHMAIVAAAENRAGTRDLYVPSSTRVMAHRSYPSPIP